MSAYSNLMTNEDKDVFIPLVPSVLGAMLMSKVSRQKEGFREDLISMVENDEVNLPKDNFLEQFKNSFVVANGFMEKWGVNYGHSSIKELDHIQMCIENKSRWFTEIIETLHNNQYWSYIEYSLRYNPPTEYVVPKELDKYPELKTKYIEFCDNCFKVYNELMPILENALSTKYPDKSNAAIKKLAFENARNVLPLSVKSNMGLSTNLRAFCDGLSELFAHGEYNFEIQNTASTMKQEGELVSTGMVKHVKPTQFMNSYVKNFYKMPTVDKDKKRKIYYRPEVFAGDIEKMGKINDYPSEVLSSMGRFDELPKDFYNIGKNITVLMSEAGHHQLIRHRALSIIPVMPSVDYGLLIPEELVNIKDREDGKKAIEMIEKVYLNSCNIYDRFMAADLIHITPYVIINANIRRVEFFGNLKAMSRFITLRTEEHAQDEIRTVASDLDQIYKEFEDIFVGLRINRK